MAAKAPRNDAKSKAPADAPVAAPEEPTATAGEASTAETGSSPAGDAVSQGAVAPAGGDPVVAGPDAGEGPQGAAENAADVASSGLPQLTGATLFLGDGVEHPALNVTLPELSSAASELQPGTRVQPGIELTPFERSMGLTDDPTEPLFSVCAPNGPRWRCGIQFGVSPKNMTGADLGADPETFWETLSSDPHLRIGPPIDTE